ncbi:MAG TPA: amino acid ABC transporter substrate-binding protein [Ruminococcaceae bacterium]|jgi:polar amino acid transport system substrate-binding protein|nr:cysteine ABC transporter substrate-binding protein [Eubacterium sp.]HBM31172.1 amino acid ABC transporter substrate-binding protein [Oscillospiraceae bacterium]HCK51027.1 amino acid ABC transporter substrate-binding protein [Oscillospiraceae bacterium]
MNTFKKIASVFAAAAMALSLAACSNSNGSSAASDSTGDSSAASGSYRTVDQIKESGEITIGVFSDKNPFGYVDNDGKFQGYDVYFADRIAKDLGVELKLVPVEAASRVEFLETAKVDIILANFTVTDERKEKVDFALPYMKVALGVVSPDSAIITDAEQLNGKTLIVVKGTTAESYFTENYPDVKLQKYDEYNEAYSALQDGRGDAFSTDNTEVLAWSMNNPGFTVGVESLGSTDAIAPAVTKGNETLLNWINDEITALADEQFFHADYDATLASVYGDNVDKDSLVVEGGVM